MDKLEYERLINQGFRIIRFHKGNIEIRTKRGGWTKVSEYSLKRWEELMSCGKTIEDY